MKFPILLCSYLNRCPSSGYNVNRYFVLANFTHNVFVLFIKQLSYYFSDGLDFFYTTESHARKMVDFIQSVLPVKSQHSKKLISHDIHSNVYNYKFTYSIEIVPVSKDSIVCLPKKLTQQLGGISPICLVHRVTSTIHLIDANTGQGMFKQYIG